MVQETITSNIHDDIITLEFQRTDGTLITQLIDFRSVSIVNLFSTFISVVFRKPPEPFFRLAFDMLHSERNKLNLNVFIVNNDMDESLAQNIKVSSRKLSSAREQKHYFP